MMISWSYNRKPRVFKRNHLWWVQRPGYHDRRFWNWREAVDCAVEWWVR